MAGVDTFPAPCLTTITPAPPVSFQSGTRPYSMMISESSTRIEAEIASKIGS